MRYIIAAAVGAAMSAGAAQAAVYDLAYTVEAEATAYDYYGLHADDEFYGMPYPGPDVGDIVQRDISVQIDTDLAGQWINGPSLTFEQYFFDQETGAISYDGMPNDDETLRFSLREDGTGSLQETVNLFGTALTYTNRSFDVLSWSVEGLPEVAPIPLPASLPLLGIGLAATGFVARRRKFADTATSKAMAN